MSGIIPSFLLRTWTLNRARSALTEGDCERALEYLAHPVLSLSRRAERMRSKALGVLWRTAARKSRSGRTDSVARLIDLVAREDPESADDWSRRLLPEERPEAKPSPSSGVRRMSTARTGSPHFHLAIDDVGEFLVACRPSLIIGHSRGDRADLPFLADLESAHARLFLEESFHGGPRWHLEGPRSEGVRDRRIRVERNARCSRARRYRAAGSQFRVSVFGSGSIEFFGRAPTLAWRRVRRCSLGRIACRWRGRSSPHGRPVESTFRRSESGGRCDSDPSERRTASTVESGVQNASRSCVEARRGDGLAGSVPADGAD